MKMLFKSILAIIASSAQMAYSGYYTAPQEVRDALDYGADTKVIFKVIDDIGRPIKNVKIDAAFSLNGRGKDVRALTDKSGCAELREKSVGEIVYTISKEGYYITSGTLLLRDFSKQDFLIKDGKWQPYGAEIPVILKKIKNPVPMYCITPISSEIPIPISGRIGKVEGKFDLKIGDWLPPYGKGEVADFNLIISKESDLFDRLGFHFRHIIEIRFPNKFDGAYKLKKELFSKFQSVYNADVNGEYQSKLIFIIDSLTGVVTTDTLLQEDESLVMRTRSVSDADGKLLHANYSKIYGEMRVIREGLRLYSYFNPTINDTSLECDTSRNLNTKRGHIENP